MRLTVLDHGHRRRAKLFLTLTSLRSRVDSPDIVKMLLYRPGLLTRALLDLAADAMRGPSYWTAAEREYLGMSIAQLHRCPFCIDTHAELVRIAGHGEIQPDGASARPEVAALRDFLERTIRTPEDVDATGIAALPQHAVLEGLRVGLVWNIVNRLANAFGFVLRDGQLETGTRALHRFGYRFPNFLLAEGKAPDRGDDVANLRYAVLEAPANTDPALRQAAAAGDPLPEPWQSYTALVRTASYKLTDAEFDRLRADGNTEDQIFEMTVAAAVGAALRSFEAGRRAARLT